MSKEFTKDMLKPGMLVQRQDGELNKVEIDDYNDEKMILVNNCDSCYGLLSNYSDNFDYIRREMFPQLDIVAIYKPKNKSYYYSYDINDHKLIWRRK